MKINKTNGNKLIILLHVLVWLLILILPFYFILYNSDFEKKMFLNAYLQLISYALIFYIHYFILIPKLFFKNKRLIYFLSGFALIIILVFSVENYTRPPRFMHHDPPSFDKMIPPPPNEGEHQHEPPTRNIPLFNFFITSLLVSGFSLGLRFYGKLAQNEKLQKEAEKEKLNSELTFLKNQMNPHFFFNTMNNIYALVQSNPDDAAKAIHTLSKLMRYMLYESEQGNTTLSNEIAFINNYLDMVRLRLSKKVELSIHLPKDYTDIHIPPLLFIPFIENAFKHGVSYKEKSFINIIMKVEQNQINFICNNSSFLTNENELMSDSGIGLENITKRLNLLFPNTHKLTITQTANMFSVNLSLQIT
jgi:two-component system, LytTR family, sensor kinase